MLIFSNFVQCVTNQVWRICKMQSCLPVSIFPHENSCRIITHSLPDSSSPLDSTLFVIVFCAYKTGYFSNTCSFYYLSVSKYTFYSCLIVFIGFALFQLCNKQHCQTKYKEEKAFDDARKWRIINNKPSFLCHDSSKAWENHQVAALR